MVSSRTQNITISRNALFWLGVAFFYISSTQLGFSQPLLTLTIPQNQRLSSQELFGVEVEFFLRNNLSQTGLVDLTSFEVTRQLPDPPPTPQHGHLLTGQFQRVGRLIFLKLNLSNPDGTQAQFKRTFEHTKALDSLEDCGKWLLQELKVNAKWPGWSLRAEEAQLLYQLRLKRYHSDQLASLDQARELFRSFDTESSEPVISEVALELLLSAQSDLEKGAPLLKRADQFLRRALARHPKSGNLLALLALNYYLSQSYPGFIEKTALEALAHAPDNELAQLLAALSAGLSSGLGKERLQKFEQLHPLAWKGRLSYLSGALDSELRKASKVLAQAHNPDPYQLRSP